MKKILLYSIALSVHLMLSIQSLALKAQDSRLLASASPSAKTGGGENMTEFPLVSFLPEYYDQITEALSHYPELKNLAIAFRYKNINATLQSRFRIKGMFSRKNRQYFVLIDNDKHNSGVLFQEAEYAAQVGVLGHELAQIADYHQRNGWQLIRFGLQYMCRPGRRKIERYTDEMAITKGLGRQLYLWNHFILEESEACDSYKCFKRRYYLSPDEILRKVNKLWGSQNTRFIKK